MILVTGGAGYIGSHCVLSLLEQKHDVLIFDNLSTGHIETVEELKKNGHVTFYHGDLLNKDDLKKIFSNYNIDAVIHFAAFSQVGESVLNPKKYYTNNVIGTINLLNTMIEFNVKKIVFSSTAATYGEPLYVPIDEKHPQSPINPYGKTKLIIENIMDDYDKAYGIKSVRLRYFNVIGADIKKRVGEWHDPETHLVPNILKSTFGNDKIFELYGEDYDTKDGTCVRDYINIEDLANAHILALKYLDNNGKTDFFNLGTNEGNTVKEIFNICEEIIQKNIKIKQMPKRAGDPAKLIADNTKAKEILGWAPQKNISESILSAYNWEAKLNEMLSK